MSADRSRPRSRRQLIAGLCAVLALAGCSSATSSTGPVTTALDTVGAGEGALTIIARDGYVEDGTGDRAQDWIHPFEKATGCTVTSKVADTPAELADLVNAGGYDVVSAPGDLSLGLILNGTVQPLNTAALQHYDTLSAFLVGQRWNSRNGLIYGIPQGWAANLLLSADETVKPAPTSWQAVFTQAAAHKWKISAYDWPISIADAALYLSKAQPDLGIKSPYALDQKQFDAAVDLLKKQRPQVDQYWSNYTTQVQAFESGETDLGSGWQQVADQVNTDKTVKVTASVPKEGTTGWSDNWMIAAGAEHPNCAYRWLDWVTSPQINAAMAKWTGQAPAQALACQQSGMAAYCAHYHAQDEDYVRSVSFWTTPTAQCVDGRTKATCVDYAQWARAWQSIKGTAG